MRSAFSRAVHHRTRDHLVPRISPPATRWPTIKEYTLCGKSLLPAAAVALLLGGTGVAHATAPMAPAPVSSITTLADDNGTATNDDDHGDKTGLWGLTGLLGLIGLAGLKRRKDTAAAYPATGTVPGNPNAPRRG
jgi:hypothetical protein